MDIIEYCRSKYLINREQYYLQILKTARSLLGFKHSEATIDIIRNAKLGKKKDHKPQNCK